MIIRSAGKTKMPKTNEPPSEKAKKQLSTEGFFDRHSDLVAELFRTRFGRHSFKLRDLANRTTPAVPPSTNPFINAVNQLEKAGFSRLLNAAELEKCPEAFKNILKLLLFFLGVETPKGVFTKTAKPPSKPGRPISTQRERYYLKWIELGRPSMFKNGLAQAIFGAQFTKANAIDRRKLRDRCRHAVERHIENQLVNEVIQLENDLGRMKEKNVALQDQLARTEAELKARKL
jgi:hypothetical protein